jgi:hypothetical protein
VSVEDPFAGSDGLPSISFASKDQYGNLSSKPVGTRIGGKVLKAPTMLQSRNFTTKQLETWPDGNPKMSVVVEIEVEGEPMSLWVKKPSALFKAFGEAIGRAGGVPVGPGAQVWVTLTGFGKPEADKAPAKLYAVEYTPANQFATEVPPTAAPATPSPSTPVAPVAVPTTPEGYTLASLQAAGWSIDQVRASYPALIPVVAPAPPAVPTPPAPTATAPAPEPQPVAPVVDAAAERAAKIAAMPLEDRQLLGLS